MIARRGQALVEFVLILPILLVLILGIISFGLYLNAANTLQQAARTGAHAAALGAPFGCPGDSAQAALSQGQTPTVYGWVDDALNADRPWLSAGSASQPTPAVSYAALAGSSASPPGPTVILTVALAYHPLIPLPGLLPATVELASTFRMLQQQPPPSGGTQTTLPSGPPYDETPQWTEPPPPASVSFLVNPPPCPAS